MRENRQFALNLISMITSFKKINNWEMNKLFKKRGLIKTIGIPGLIEELSQRVYYHTLKGDVKIPHSRMTKTCWETFVTSL